MVQNETNLVVADNSGARSVRVFHLLGGSVRRASSVGDVVICAVKDALPNGKIKRVTSSKASSLELRKHIKDQMVPLLDSMITQLLSLTKMAAQKVPVSLDQLLEN